MMPQLENIIKKLKSDQYFAVRINDADTARLIGTNMTGAKMVEQYGSVEQYFNDIVANQGYTRLIIQPRRSNGSSFKDAGEAFPLNVTPLNNAPQPKSYQAHIDFTPTQHQGLSAPEVSTQGLMAGLNAIDAVYRYQDYPKVVAENERLKNENERLKEKIEDQKEKILEHKYSTEKSAGNAEMWQGLLANAPQVLQALGSLKGGGAASGLASPAQANENLSHTKAQLIQYVHKTDDHSCFCMLKVFEGVTTSEAFADELFELLTKHKLISTGNGQ